MIEELEYKPFTDQFGTCYGTTAPSTRQIVDKINEIIYVINNQK